MTPIGHRWGASVARTYPLQLSAQVVQLIYGFTFHQQRSLIFQSSIDLWISQKRISKVSCRFISKLFILFKWDFKNQFLILVITVEEILNEDIIAGNKCHNCLLFVNARRSLNDAVRTCHLFESELINSEIKAKQLDWEAVLMQESETFLHSKKALS